MRGTRRLHLLLVVDLLDRVGHRHAPAGPPRSSAALAKTLRDQRLGQAGPHGVVDGDELDLRLDQGQGVGDRLEALGAAVGDLHVHEGEVGAVAAAEHLLIVRRDDDDALATSSRLMNCSTVRSQTARPSRLANGFFSLSLKRDDCRRRAR